MLIFFIPFLSVTLTLALPNQAEPAHNLNRHNAESGHSPGGNNNANPLSDPMKDLVREKPFVLMTLGLAGFCLLLRRRRTPEHPTDRRHSR